MPDNIDRARAPRRSARSRSKELLGAVGLSALLAAGIGVGGASAQEMQDDTIRFATTTISPSFGRPEAGTASPSVYTLWPIYETLTRASPTGDVSGLLATSWNNIDKTTWRFTLRRGVKFQNGKDFTAKFVAAQINHLLNNEEAQGTVAFSTNKRQAKMNGARAIDDYTVEITTETPVPELPRQMAGFWLPDTETRDDIGLDGFNKAPIGTGPFKAVNFGPGQVDYEAFAGAWRPAKVKRLRLVELPDAATRVTSILSGEIDISQGVPFDAIKQLEDGGHRVDIAERPSVMGWRFMSVRESSPFHDKRVRQAANYAIDRNAISKELLGGVSPPAGQCATRGTFGYNPNVGPYPFDPGKARALLAEAGYADGFDTEAMVLPGAFPADAEIYQFAAQQLAAVGIRVKLTNIQFAEWLDNWFGKKKAPDGTMGMSDIFQNSCHNFNAIPFDAYPNLSCQKPLPSHCDEEESALLTAAFEEFDTEKRRKLIQDLMVLNHENAPNLFFVDLVDMTGVSGRVQNFSNIIQRFSWDTITLKN